MSETSTACKRIPLAVGEGSRKCSYFFLVCVKLSFGFFMEAFLQEVWGRSFGGALGQALCPANVLTWLPT